MKFNPCPTIQEAIDLLKEENKKIDDYHIKLKSSREPSVQIMESKEYTQEELEELKRLNRNYERVGYWLFTLPWIRPHLKAFMIDIKYGDERAFSHLLPKEKSSCGQNDMVGLLHMVELLRENPKEFTAKTGGALFQEIEDFLSSHGFVATDRGCGGCGGHLGYPCTESERDILLSLLHFRFGAAIRSGMISTTIAWFKVGLYGSRKE